MEASNNKVMMFAVSFVIFCIFFLEAPSNFAPLARSFTSKVISRSSSKSQDSNSSWGSVSGTSKNFVTTFDFAVFGSFPTCFSNCDFPSIVSPILDAYTKSDKIDVFLISTICLIERSFFLIVRISSLEITKSLVIAHWAECVNYSELLKKLLKCIVHEYRTWICSFSFGDTVIFQVTF